MINLKELSLLDILPENIKTDESAANAAEAIDHGLREATGDIKYALIIPRIDELPNSVLDLLAWQFHVDLYDPDWAAEIKRGLIKEFVAWHQIKGTKAGILGLLGVLGYSNVEIIEYHEARQAYLDAGILFVDGTWLVTGNSPKIIQRSYDVSGWPDIPHWAQFAVKLDLAEAARTEWLNEIKWAIEEMKPARAWPIWFYIMKLNLDMAILVKCTMPRFYMLMQAQKYYPWCRLMVDGSWVVGPDPKPYTIDTTGQLIADGSWKVGELIFFEPVETVYPCMAEGFLTIIPHIVSIGHPWDLREDDRIPLRADGSWQVGYTNTVNVVARKYITKNIITGVLNPSWEEVHKTSWEWMYAKKPNDVVEPKIDGQLVDGSWVIGGHPLGLLVDGTWDIGLNPMKAFGFVNYATYAQAPVGGVVVGYDENIFVDGSWNVGDSGPRASAKITYL